MDFKRFWAIFRAYVTACVELCWDFKRFRAIFPAFVTACTEQCLEYSTEI